MLKHLKLHLDLGTDILKISAKKKQKKKFSFCFYSYVFFVFFYQRKRVEENLDRFVLVFQKFITGLRLHFTIKQNR